MSESTKGMADRFANERENAPEVHEAPGTAVLVIILLVTFAVYYFANWKALADAWHVR